MNWGEVIAGAASILSGAQTLRGALGNVPQSPKRVQRLKGGNIRTNGKAPKGQIHRVKNIDERVKYIVRMIQKGRSDPRIRALATQIVSQKCGKKWCIEERDYSGEVRAVFNWIRSNVRYVKDAIHLDQFQHPARTLEWGGGDCDDYCITMGSILQAIGYPIRLRVIQPKGSSDWNHIDLLVGLPPGAPTRWVSLDASVNHPAGWAPPRRMIKRIKDYEVPVT